AGQFLCHQKSAFVEACKPEWLPKNDSALEEKIAFLSAAESNNIFPFPEQLSTAIEKESFLLSFLQQPDVFLRLRPGKEKMVVDKLQKAAIPFSQEGFCLRLPAAAKIDDLLRIDEEAVVQDISSQRVLELLQARLTKTSFTAWDCCAASGGKTILLHDAYPQAKLTVSDIRESIIINLKNRLKRAGIAHYRSFVGDVSSPQFTMPQQFDVIVCDAPCSGSGTWGRTPEQLVFFKQEKIMHYAGLQKSIAVTASHCLKKGGFFLYITCSVFAEENERVTDYLQQEKGLQLLSQQYFNGYDKKGDTLFAALFTI
ncbi:MAG: methyltransferase domain-containing protein, partial [Bacteroidota bacterium]|nr:methyltransferase domain-containing protein [Bacteroidota bacterium]